jgi:hypothetical protein
VAPAHVYSETVPHLKWKRTGAAILLTLAPALCSSFLQACGGSRERAEPGAPCDESTGCAGGLQCIVSGSFPGGYCSSVCADGACVEGAICASELMPPLCLRGCDDPSDCRDGYQCWRGACRPGCDVDPNVCGDGATCVGGVCEGPECASDPECGAGRRCEGGRCVTAPPPVDAGPDGASGSPCSSDVECISGVCLPADRGGICSDTCAQRTDCIENVDFDAACSPVVRGGSVQTLCVPYDHDGAVAARQCASDGDCATGTCVDAQCTEACADAGDCLRGQACVGLSWGGGTFTGCGYAPGSGVVSIDLGEHTLGAGAGTSDLVFATPPDSVSVTLRAQTLSGDPLPLSFYDIHDPRDQRIFLLDEIAELRDQPLRWIPADTEEAIAALVPNATPERLPYVPGAHRVRVLALPRSGSDDGSVRVRVSALVKRAPGGTVSAGTLDLDVHLVGVGVTAAQAPSNSRVQSMLSRFRTLMSRASITVGDVAYHDVTTSTLAVIDTIEGSGSELASLFRLSAPRSGNRVSIFLVRYISDGMGTLGIAGGIPGPSGIHGSMHSGVVVSFDPGTCDAADCGEIMAHEVGHFLGLYHVTERLRPCGAGESPPGCSPFGGSDVIGDTTRGDTTNLMNWSIGGTQLSSGQRFVMVRSALVR